ncbi:hypothetical protein DFH06DRAFT_771507 [Mycena polygramma]|nr:hypothetical protein DFH06DRAFT_771507 [Mycena polygramma]
MSHVCPVCPRLLSADEGLVLSWLVAPYVLGVFSTSLASRVLHIQSVSGFVHSHFASVCEVYPYPVLSIGLEALNIRCLSFWIRASAILFKFRRFAVTVSSCFKLWILVWHTTQAGRRAVTWMH